MDDQVMGVARQGLGRVEDAVGGLTGDAALQAKGKVRQAAGSLQQAFGDAKSSVRDAAEELLGDVRGQIQDRLGAVESRVIAKPLPALAIAAMVGIVLGLMLRGRRTVYLRDGR